jgi:hypothetical protein
VRFFFLLLVLCPWTRILRRLAALEGLLQVASCTSYVGWRSNARHIVFVATDADFHLAGDGFRAGLFRKNPGTCYVNMTVHTTETQRQLAIDTGSVSFDYPSIGQVAQMLIDGNIVPIFAYKDTSLTEEAVNSQVRACWRCVRGVQWTHTLRRTGVPELGEQHWLWLPRPACR